MREQRPKHYWTALYAADPERCHCGAMALYKAGAKGYCKTHHADALKAQAAEARRLAGKHSADDYHWRKASGLHRGLK